MRSGRFSDGGMMTEPFIESSEYTFKPSLFPGLLLLIPLTGILTALTIFLFLFFSRQQPGLLFFLSFIFSVALLLPIGMMAYRTYALITANYQLARGSLRIKWGLRHETIPLSEIDWIRTPAEMRQEIPWPFLPMPGAYLGKVQTSNSDPLEFMASSVKNMLFVGTSQAVFGISPAKPQQFLSAFERVMQMGTLHEIPHETVRPADWIASSWGNRTARGSIILSVGLLMILSLWIGFRLSGLLTVPLTNTIDENISSGSRLPARNVILLPALAAILWLVNLAAGVQIYKTPSLRKMAELVWGASPIMILLFLIAGFFVI